MVNRFVAVIFVLFLASCGVGPDVGESQIPGIFTGEGKARLVVAATDFGQVGKLYLLDLKSRALQSAPIHSDAIVRCPNGSPFVYVVNRYGADNLQVIDKKSARLDRQIRIETVENFQDVLPLNDEEGLVSSLKGASIVRANLKTGAVVREYSFLGMKDSDGLPIIDADGHAEFTTFYRQGNRAWVNIQRLNSEANFVPTEKSYLGVIDLLSNSVEKVLPLSFTNPVGDLKSDSFGNLFIGQTGIVQFGKTLLDGGIEKLFVGGLESRGITIRESELGGDLLEFEILGENLGVASVAVGLKTKLVAFNPSSGFVSKTLLESSLYSFQSMAVDRVRKLLFVADRDLKAPSIRVFDTETLVERTDLRLDLELPPFHIALTD